MKDMNHTQPRVLFVDDEVNILKSLKRSLIQLDIELLFAESAKEALEIIKQTTLDVVVSDMKMPKINGAQLLEKTAELQPHTYRVVLTGFADVDSLQKAVNQGKAHRFLNKPWDIEELKAVIEEGAERCRLRMENAKLLALTEKQNNQLKDVNSDLEKTVQLRTKQIKQALNSIKRRSEALEKVLYNVIVINTNIDGEFARLVSDSALAMADALKLEESERDVVSFSALLCEIGMLGLAPEIVRKTASEMNYEEQKQYVQQVEFAKLILAPAVDLDVCIDSIAMQFEELTGNVKEVPIGSKIIAICRDYWRYRLGRMTEAKFNNEDTIIELRKYVGSRYDKDLLELFETIATTTLFHIEENQITSSELKPGMRLKTDLYNVHHILLLPKGHIFTEQSIAKLKLFEKGSGISVSISVYANDSDSDSQNGG